MEALRRSLARLGAEPKLEPLFPPVRADVAVVDSYHFRADDPAVVDSRLVIAVDDLMRNLRADIVIDSAPGATSHDHRAAGLALTGTRYALVDPTLRGVRPELRQRPEVVLVTTGASDTEGFGAGIAEALAAAIADAEVKLVVGPHEKGELPAGVRLVRGGPSIRAALACADVVVTAGGVSMLEALCLGRPTVALCRAENQRRYVEGAESMGAVLKATPATVVGAVARLLNDPFFRSALSGRGALLIDGFGSERVAKEILALRI